ncbi:hypothetical protein [Pseudomonas sp. Hg5Tf]|uniref:RiboL-PSP-HEPN domain-containing protein n=1 Tax=Pseudomonas sp. Hg7Tf TaxID=3236988 RepID=A0AB39I698_9PSED|nr:hypothetical protein [Pseudomonas sp. Hg5Tf]MDH2558355.1 hypothetical protein [Pseudomonas sp. Hg5Tf]
MAGHVYGETELITYVYFHIGARSALRAAAESTDGQLYNLLNAMVMSAFTVEGYFNHLGEKFGYPEWNNGEDRRTKIWDKYPMLRKKVGLQSAKIKESYPLVADLLDFRNSIAHGRTATHKIDQAVDGVKWPHREKIPVGWQVPLNPEHVQDCFESMRQLIIELNVAAGLGDKPFQKMGTSTLRFVANEGSSLF